MLVKQVKREIRKLHTTAQGTMLSAFVCEVWVDETDLISQEKINDIAKKYGGNILCAVSVRPDGEPRPIQELHRMVNR